MLHVVIVSLLAAALADEVPLIEPTEKAAAPVVAPAPAPMTPAATPPPAEHLLSLGAVADGLVKTGQQRVGAGGALEVGFRLPFLGARLGFLFSPSVNVFFGSATTAWLSVPLGLSYHERLGPGHLRLRGAVAFDYSVSRAPRAGLAPLDDTYYAVSGEGAAAYLIALGPGSVILELMYHFLPMAVAGSNELNHVFGLRAGYTFWLL